MDYFFMNECIFKILLTEHKKFIIKLLKSINIFIDDYQIFNINESSNEVKVDLLLFTKDTIINIQLNKTKQSLTRNKIYIECLNKILPDYKLIQINMNLFKTQYNLYNTNEYIKFITSKKYINFKTKNKYINNVIKYFKNIDINKYKKKIEKEQTIKRNIDALIKE